MAKAFFRQNPTTQVWEYGTFKDDGTTPDVECTIKGDFQCKWETKNGVVLLTIRDCYDKSIVDPFKSIPISDVASNLTGTAYANRAAFETATKDFFFNVAQSGGTVSAGFSTVRLTGDGGTDYDAPSDLNVSGSLFALNPDDAEVSSLMVGEVKTIRFAIAPIVGDFPLVVYTKT